MTDTTIDPMDAAVSATIQGTAGQIRTSLGAALPVNPDKEAQLRRYAAAARVPLEAARALPEDVKVQAQLSQVDTDVLARKFPSTAQLLANPDLARIAHDDVPALTAVETAAHQVGAPPNPGGVFLEPGPDPSYMSQMRDWVFGKLGLEKPSEHKDEASSARAFLDSYAKQTGTDRQGLRDAVGGMSPVGQQFSSGFFDSATGGLAPGNAGAPDTTAGGVAHGAGELSGFLLGAPLKVGSWLTAKTLGSVTTHAATDSWVKALSRDVLRQSATLGAAGAVGATGTALDQSTPGAALSVVGQGAKSGAETGALFGAAGRLLPDNTLAQGALRFLGISAAQDLASGQNPFDDRPAAQKVFDYGMNAVFAAHGAGRVHEAAGWVHDMTAESYAAHVADVETRAANEQLTGLADVASKSALRERAPEVFRQLVADMADRGNLPTIHVDSGALLKILGEAGITGDELRQKMPRVADQLGDALHDNAPTNLLIDVPIEDFATHIAGSPIEKAFLQEARVTPAGGSMADAEAFKQAQKGEMAARVGKLDALHADDQAYHDSLAKMNAQVDEQLAGLKMRPDQLETNSALLRAFYQTQADHEGMLPHEFAEKYPVQGSRRLGDGAALEQAAGSLADVKAAWDAAGVSHSMSERDGTISLDRIVIPKDQRLQGKGTAAMRALLDYADRTGQRVVLTPSADFGGTKSRLVAFYKSMGFAPNKGRAKDFTTQAAMIRAPRGGELGQDRYPETAAIRAATKPISIEDARALVSGKTEKPGGVDPVRILGAGAGNGRTYRIGDVPISAFIENQSGDRYDDTVDRNRANDYAGRDGKSAPPVIATQGRNDGRLRINDGGHRLTAARLRGDTTIRALIAIEASDALDQKRTATDAPRGTFSPSEKTITLLKDANLSTFQHELGHFFLDTLADVAARPGASAGAQADMAAFLTWRGIPDLETWHRMDLEEQREHHEAFATGWETYLMKGQAPSLELRGLFSRFRAWMLSVYQSLKGAPGDFTPEVRGVFDRMIASEDAIHNAELARRYMPLFDTPEASGMTPEEWTAYQAKGRDATEVATEELIAKTMKDMAKVDRLRTASLRAVQKDAAEKRKVIEHEVRAEVMSQPVYRAWSFLTGKDAAQLPDEVNAEHKQAVRDWSEKQEDHEAETTTRLRGAAWEASPESKLPGADGLAKGRWLAKNRSRITLDIQREMLDYDAAHPKPKTPEKPDTASKDPTTGAGKLNLEATRALAGKDATTKLQALRMTSAKGIEPGVVADMFGFADGKALADALLAAEPPRAVVDGITEQRMLERHGEIANPEAMARTADELVQNEVRTLFVATELRALKKATGTLRDGKGGASDLAKAAKEVAANTIDSRRIRDISESQYAAAETRSAAQAERAMVKGDLEGAAVAKRDQLLNMELTRAARDARDFVAKALTYLAKFDKASVRESIDLEYRDQIDALLDRADLRKSVTNTALDKRASLEAFVEKMAAAGYEPNIPPGLLDEAQRWHYKDMPLVAFRGLVESIKSIEHLGKLKNELRDLQETRAINDLANEVRDTAAKLPQRTPESNRGMTRIDAAWLKAKSFGRSAQASLLKMEQIFDWLDARNSNGVLNRVVMRRFAEAGARENDMLAVVKGQIDELVKSNLDEIAKTKQIFTSQLVDSRTGQFAKFTTKEMLMLAGNVGNDSNLMKLAKGENWDPAEIMRFLHENMTSAHWDFVEGLGRTLETLWPEKLAMDRRLGNTSPQKIEPRPFQTADGKTRAGWYWPMIYDPARSQDVAERGAAKGDALFENIYTKANSDTGRMNTRNENYARPVLLDLDALPRVIKEEIHDVAWREAVIDADRFLSHPTVRRAIIDSLSQEHYDQIRPWLQSIANDGHLGVEGNRGWVWMNKVAGLARTRATIVGLGFRLSTAIVHGLSAGMESVAELGPVWMGKGLAEFANPAKWSANKDFIFERSGEMRHRMNEGDRDVREHLRQIDLRLMDPASNALSRGRDLMQSHAYSLITGLDMASAMPTWMGAYLKALHPTEKGGLGMSEADAIYFADKTVRNAHGGTGVKDMAAIQRGSEFQKLFTMFYTFWNHNVNRLMDTGKLIASSDHRAAMKEANGWSDTHMASVIIMRTMIYTFGIQAMHGLLHPPKDGEADSWLTWAGKTLGASALDGIPIARDLYAHMVTGRDYTVTPAASVVDMVGKTGTDAAAALQGKEVSPKWLKHEMTTLGVVFGLPTGQPASTAQFLWDVAAGKDDPQTAADWWNGVLHGDMKHH